MNKFLLVFFIFVFYACDSYEERITDANVAPSFRHEIGDTLTINFLEDTFKLSHIDYHLPFGVFDSDNNLDFLHFTSVLSKGDFFVNEKRITTRYFFGREEVVLKYLPAEVGTHVYELEVYDDFGVSASLPVSLFVFDNLDPVAVLESLSATQANTYRVDASASYDGDLEYGGTVIKYELTLPNLLSLEYEESIFVFSYASSVDFDIFLRVQDDEGLWSERIRQRVSVRIGN